MPPDPYNPWATPIFPGASAFGVGSPAETAERQPTIVDNLLSHIAGALGRGFMAPGQALQSTQPITSEQMIAPAQDMSTAMSTGAGAMPASANELRMGIKAYHGSPHDFERFDLSKIGTGEGAQAYGHGLYFADNEGVARAYRNQLSDAGHARVTGGLAPKEEYVFDRMSSGASEMDILKDFASRYGGSFDDAVATMDKVKGLNRGKMYEVNINADPAHFLDWDKPLPREWLEKHMSAFPEVLAGDAKQRAFLGPEKGYSGRSAYAKAADWNTAQNLSPENAAGATKALADAGIPGIKYLDQGSRPNIGQVEMFRQQLATLESRGASQAAIDNVKRNLTEAEKGISSNYVVFNDKLIDIIRKYAIPGMFGAPIFANAIGEQKS